MMALGYIVGVPLIALCLWLCVDDQRRPVTLVWILLGVIVLVTLASLAPTAVREQHI